MTITLKAIPGSPIQDVDIVIQNVVYCQFTSYRTLVIHIPENKINEYELEAEQIVEVSP